jgi:hypothetical protein
MRRSWLAIAGTIVAMAIVIEPAIAQVSAPVRSGDPIESRTIEGATTREGHNSYIEARALASQASGQAPAARYRNFVIAWPDGVEEYQRMARYSVMLLTVTTQNRAELPLARVYVRAGGSDVALKKLSSTRSEYAANDVVAKMFGRYREDAFYLVPGAALMREGAVLADFTTVRKEMGVVVLPTKTGRERAKDFSLDNPLANAEPDAATFKVFFNREFPGFPPPKR